MEHISTKKRPIYSPYTPSLRPPNPIYVPQNGSILAKNYPFWSKKQNFFITKKWKNISNFRIPQWPKNRKITSNLDSLVNFRSFKKKLTPFRHKGGTSMLWTFFRKTPRLSGGSSIYVLIDQWKHNLLRGCFL